MNYDSLLEFLTRVKKMANTNSRDLRLSAEDATVLAASVAHLLTELRAGGSTPRAASPTVMGGRIDGGSFTDR